MTGRRPGAIPATLRAAQSVESPFVESLSAVANHGVTTWARPLRSLVIGIGNPLRSDDGVGWRLAEEVDGLAVHQLTPELAAELARVDRVLFVDAWQAPLVEAGSGRPQPRLRPLPALGDTSGGTLGCSHRLEPAELLALAAALYGAMPVAAELLLPAWGFAHGTGLSPALRRQLPQARRLLRHWLVGQGLGDADA